MLEVPADGELLAYGDEKALDSVSAEKLNEVGAKVMEAEIVPSGELAAPASHKETAVGDVGGAGKADSQEKVTQKENSVVAVFDSLKAATAGSFRRTCRAAFHYFRIL